MDDAMRCDLLRRRDFLALVGSLAVAPVTFPAAAANAGDRMYGLIGKVTAVQGQRDTLAAILLGSNQAMPGCLSYIVAHDPADADALWITEVWDSQASHQASLSLPAVREAITKGRPLIAGFSNRVETTPIGGVGLKP